MRILRDDSRLSRLLGGIAPGAVPPLLSALTGALVVGTLLAADQGRLAGITLFAPVAALLLSGLASGHPHDGRFDRLVPPVLRLTEYGYLSVLGLASGVPGPLVFVLLVVVVCHHRDEAARPAAGTVRPESVRAAALGWDGRMLVTAVGGAFHTLTPVYGILAGYLAVLLVREAVRTWSATPVADVRAGAAPGDGGAGRSGSETTRTGHADGGQPAAGTNGEA
ncbi:hypothetical protein NOSIN_17625 [Nocardiopsis sinuspersici]|uniref:DUF5941 domain-containing protein n=1 Tax=Nocardiopsis sinuspersici TaxID=501010 RepID=A0A1V3C929_9ACTN|nr:MULTISPECIES: DUF5941 domain-containing protein [Nocardiopsis]OOC57281.1 hypothetical protein NOSIN_17625 [Nocardiopsis sinuspersici]